MPDMPVMDTDERARHLLVAHLMDKEHGFLDVAVELTRAEVEELHDDDHEGLIPTTMTPHARDAIE